MTTKQTTIRLAPETRRHLDELSQQYGTRTAAIAVAVDRLHKEMTMAPRPTWTDVLGNNISAIEALELAHASGLELPQWIEQQAKELYGDGPDWCDHDWCDLAADLRRDADQLGFSICGICGARIDTKAPGWREGDTSDICADCISAAE
jgi:hypothetical protein